MKSSNTKSGNYNFNKSYLFLVFLSTISFSQEVRQTQDSTLKVKSDLSSVSVQNNPYFQSNELEGEMTLFFEENNRSNTSNSFPTMNSVSNVLKTKHDTAKNSVGNIR